VNVTVDKSKLSKDEIPMVASFCRQLRHHLQECIKEAHQSYIPCGEKPISYLECPLNHQDSQIPHLRLDEVDADTKLICPKSGEVVLKDNYDMLSQNYCKLLSHDICCFLNVFFLAACKSEVVENIEDVLFEFSPKLVASLPMDDPTFVANLRAARLLPGNLKAKIKSLPTSADKADHFLDYVILPDISNNHDSLLALINVMECSEYPKLNKLARELKGVIYI